MADDPKRLDGDLRVRLNEVDLNTFADKCERELKKPYQIFLREIITAYNEDRLNIKTTHTSGELYNVD